MFLGDSFGFGRARAALIIVNGRANVTASATAFRFGRVDLILSLFLFLLDGVTLRRAVTGGFFRRDVVARVIRLRLLRDDRRRVSSSFTRSDRSCIGVWILIAPRARTGGGIMCLARLVPAFRPVLITRLLLRLGVSRVRFYRRFERRRGHFPRQRLYTDGDALRYGSLRSGRGHNLPSGLRMVAG